MRAHLKRRLLLVLASLFAVSCGARNDAAYHTAAAAVEASRGKTFSGNWNVTLTTVKDGCGLGVKTLPAKVAIAQRGGKAAIQIQGLKKYSGTVKTEVLSGGGRFVSGSSAFKGRINAVLTAANRIQIASATLSIKSPWKSCTVKFKGSGKRI